MKEIIVFCFLVFFFSYCSEPSKKETIKKPVIQSVTIDSIKQIEENTSEKFTSGIPINRELPFGCSLLVTYKFPDEWNSNNVDDLKGKEHEKKFLEIGECFRSLNFVNSINSPKIFKIEYINLKYPWSFNDSLIRSLDSIKYRLPNIGPYECFYSYKPAITHNKSGVIYNENDDSSMLPGMGATGNLILYNAKTNNVKVLNIYGYITGTYTAYARHFYINNNTIQIFHSQLDEGNYALLRAFTINIREDGEISIDENKKSIFFR